MKIVVLGASGFIGRNMADHFSSLGHEVHRHGFTRAQYSYPGETWIKADLREPFDFDGYDVVIQAAATTSGSKDIVGNPAIHVTDNAIMNALIFRNAVQAKVKHLIFFSCSTMFSNGVVSEKSLTDIHPKYFGVAHTKLYNEKMCEFYSRIGNTKFTVVRHSNIYGPHDKYDLERSHFFGATITKVMQADDRIVVWGTGEEARDILHVDDLCSFVEIIIKKQYGKFELYNCGSGVAVPIKDLVKKIIDSSGKNLSIDYDLSAPSIPTSLSLDCAKAHDELGWKPRVGLMDGISKTLEWYKNEFLQK